MSYAWRENNSDHATVRIINVPLDLGASRRGTDAGPSALRIAGLAPSLKELGYRLDDQIDVVAPAMEVRPAASAKAHFKEEILTVCEELANEVQNTMRAGARPLIIGGDHSIAMGSISGVAAHFKETDQQLGVIWFDAHADMNLPQTSPSGNIHGMPLAHLLGYGDADLSNINAVRPALQAQHVVLVGVRDIDPAEREFVRETGVTVFSMRDIDQKGMAAVTREALAIVNRGTAGFHLSFDVDACDPEFMPGSGTLVPGGVSYREAHLFLEECALSGTMTSMDLVELNPFLDHKNVSAERAVSLVLSAFGRSIL